MATVTDVEVANASFPNVRQDLNDILEALATNFSADAEPSTMYANQFWYETDTNLLKFRNEDNDAWITLAYFDQTNDEWEVRTAVIQAVDSAGVVIKTDEGTTRVSIADDGSVTINTSLDVDNIKIDGNSITSTDTNGNINITPNGTGKVVLDGLSYPTADGTDGQVLTTDGSGNIAFEDAGGAGKVLQVVSTTKTNVFDTSSSTYVDITGFSVSITPSSTSSKILVVVNVLGSQAVNLNRALMRLMRDSTEICVGDSASNRTPVSMQSSSYDTAHMTTFSQNFLDSPNSTSSLTYKVQVKNSGASPIYINRTNSDSDIAASARGASTITVMEIAG